MANIPSESISTSIDTLLASYAGPPSNIPTSGGNRAEMKCCCGREDCAYLKYNTVALDGLEKDVRTAAGLGQALLVRHEQYMHDAARERIRMADRISTLEDEKKNLEQENSRTIEENRGLLDQLEQLNATALESEAHIESLEATLQSAQQEVKRLDTLAARAERLEMQVAELESEQNLLQTQVIRTREDERFAIRRWEHAERELSHLENQLEIIDREAREERERHTEILSRMERQKAVGRELDTAARRLKGRAAMTAVGGGKAGTNVVSHFVKDILQDNANLQLGIMELRELLSNSNDEVQHLRERFMEHQPMVEDGRSTPNLGAELAAKETANQELHIHHHYHPPARPVVKKKRVFVTGLYTPPPGTPKHRGRGYNRMGDSRSPQYSDQRRRPDFMQPAPPSTAAAILSQTSITVPSAPNATRGDHRWSLQTLSDFAPSSAPSSPNGSMYRNSTLFDMGSRAGFYGDEESRPTSPGSSVGVMSPTFTSYHKKRASERSFTAPSAFIGHHAIQEEGDDGWNADVDELKGLTPSQATGLESRQEEHDQNSDFPTPSLESDNLDNTTTEDENEHGNGFPDTDESQNNIDRSSTFVRNGLPRTASHESIISISGLDIHTLKSRPQQIEIVSPYKVRRNNASNSSFTPTPSLLSSSFRTTGPIIGASDATAIGIAADGYGLGFNPRSARRGTSTTYLRENFIAAGQRAVSSPQKPTNSDTDLNSGTPSRKLGLRWISPFSRWGANTNNNTAPTISHSSNAVTSRDNLRSSLDVADNLQASSSASVSSFQSSTSAGSLTVSVSAQAATTASLIGRSPGINQRGPVPGWVARQRTPLKFQVRPERVDLEGLSRALEEEE